ncbi:MAG: CoA ester lyase [Alphaproteobacteria bacterium]|nr:CoA ester lyase [Alphaproteobacteria bacterium]
MSAIRPRRSVLYMPGANERALEKAKSLPADALILDLEDAVAPEAKVEARRRVCETVSNGGFGLRELIIRINGLETEWGRDDLSAAVKAKPDVILVPKVTSSRDIAEIDGCMKAAGAPANLKLWVMIETPLAILNIQSIADQKRTTSLEGFVIGANDLIKDIRGEYLPDRSNISTSLQLTIIAARAYDLLVFDGVFNDISDSNGFDAEARQAKAYGFDGKTLIHPSQIDPCNTIFAPAANAVDHARAVIAAFDDPLNAGKGVLKVNGKMTELLHLAQAKRTVAIAEAIAQREAVS